MPRCPTCHRRLASDARCPGDGSLAPGDALPGSARGPAPRVAGYDVLEHLGSGGFAEVWAARRRHDSADVALKIALDRNPRVEQRLALEAETLARIGPPHVPACHDTGRAEDGRTYVAMERLHGHTLATVLASLPGPPPSGWVQRVCHGVLAALDAVHARGVIHRDLKPDNVFMVSGAAPEIRLVDFGLTKAVAPEASADLTRPGEVLGSAEYMAPEQLRAGAPTGVATDLYAFGAILYELLTLRPPFVGHRAAIEHGHVALRPPRLRQLRAVPAPVEELALSCLAKNPARRPASAAALQSALAAAWSDTAADGRAAGGDSRVSLLVERRQPVILAAVEADAAAAELLAIVRRHGGFAARQHGDRCVFAFSGMLADNPFEAALAAVRELVEMYGARAVIHLTRLAIRRKRRGPPAVIGEAVDTPGTWLPAGAFRGVVLTRAAAESQPEDTLRPAPGLAGFFVIADEPAMSMTRLRGRDELMAQAAASLRVCLDTCTPGLFTLLGDAGLGKTRLAHELAGLARELCPEAQVIAARATRVGTREAGDADQRVHAVCSALGLSMGHDTAAPDPRAAAVPTVILLDDAHRADSQTLDQLEYAALDHPRRPLWVVVIAHPHLEAMRGQWGLRAHRHDRAQLTPLPLHAAMDMAAELLLPAEYPPAAFLRHLAQWAGGNPQLLTGLVAELRRRGAVRRRAHGEGWDVIPAELDRLPAAPAGQWLATRTLDTLPPELAACARVCAVLGPTFTVDELAWVQDAMEQHGGASTPVDAESGLGELVAQGILEEQAFGAFAFARPSFQDALYQLLAADDREDIHRHAAAYFGARLSAAVGARTEHAGADAASEGARPAPAALEHFARHAGACGRTGEAAEAHVQLGDAALATHNYVEADRHYTAALRVTDRITPARARAHARRGMARHHMHRIDEAFEDLRAARELWESLGDDAALVDLMLAQATATDAAWDWERSARYAQEASEQLARLDEGQRTPLLATRCLLAEGRSAWRQGRVAEAIAMLSEAAERAEAADDHETVVIAGLLLGSALMHRGERDRAEAMLGSVIARCVRARDRLHECRAYANGMYLWRHQPERAIGDLRRAIQLAREVGNPEPERAATHNLAELLYWSGAQDEALTLARRSFALQTRFWKHVPCDELLLARIHAARGELAEARAMIDSLTRACAPDAFEPAIDILYRMVRLILAELDSDAAPGERAAAAQWQELVAQAGAALPEEETIEVLWWCARASSAQQRWQEARAALAQAQARLDDTPIWRQRVEELARELA